MKEHEKKIKSGRTIMKRGGRREKEAKEKKGNECKGNERQEIKAEEKRYNYQLTNLDDVVVIVAV